MKKKLVTEKLGMYRCHRFSQRSKMFECLKVSQSPSLVYDTNEYVFQAPPHSPQYSLSPRPHQLSHFNSHSQNQTEKLEYGVVNIEHLYQMIIRTITTST